MIGTSKNIWGFDPRSVPGCQLWLDGADSNTVTGTTSVTAWRDKSGNGFNGTVVNASVGSPIAPSYVTNSINGLSAITMSGSSYFTGSTNVNSTTLTCFFIGNCVYGTGGSTQQRILGIGSPGLADWDSTLRAIPLAVIGGGTTLLSYRNANLASATVVSGTNFIGCCLFDGTSNYMYKDGTLGTQVASSGTFTTSIYSIGADAGTQSPGDYLYGKVGEILVYNTALTTSQRQQVEGYLAWKWGLTRYSPVTPLSIPGCQLWLDAADASTITGTTSVTAWRDKSGNSNNPTIFGSPNITVGTINNVKAMWFNGTSGTWGAFSNSGATVSGFAVGTMNSGTAGYGRMIGLGNNPGNDAIGSGFCSLLLRKDSTQGLCTRRFDTDYTYSNYTYDTPFLASVIYDGTNGNLYINGATIVQFGSTGNFGYSNYSVGCGIYSISENTIDTWKGYVGEVILYRNALTTTQRQSIEGYLARKWGFTSMYSALPSIHPFSSIRPHVRTFQPADIPGCQLWLDAADASSLVLSGSNVTQWNDKSGNGYHMNTIAGSTIWSGTPEYPTIGTSINGLQTVNFKAQSGLKQSTTLDGVKNLFWVGRIADATGSGTGPYYFLLGHDTHYDWHTPIGQKFIQSGAAQDGIANAFPASLFTSDANAVTNTAFSSINLPSPPNVSLLSVAGITGNSRYQGICYDRTTHIGWCGDLAEVLIFNTALTTSQRQQVEGYLAQKWGLTPYLPVISPLSIPGCSLWLDGADPAGTGVTPSNGATVSTWVDKATAKNATATGTPTYLTGGGINFNGSSYFLNQAFTMNLSQRSIFIVMQETSRTIYSGVFLLIPTPNSSNDHATNTSISVETTNGLYFANESYASRLGNSTLLVKAIYNDNMSGTTGSGYFNGTNATNVTAGAVAGTCSGYGVGGRWLSGSMSDSLRLNGIIYEIIVFNTPLNTSQRQSIEGYLARKWGISISATLPSPHPFKSILPATAAHFYPTDITGCSLWLDAADSSTLVLSGSNVTQWNDKSGNGRNVSASSSYPTFTTNGILFNGATPNVLSNAASFPSTTALNSFVVFRSTVASTRQRVFVYSYSGQNRYVSTDTTFNSMSTNASQGYGPVSYSPNTTYIYSANTYTGSSISHSENGVESSYQLEPATVSSTKLIVGGESTVYFTGTICEIILYDAFFTTSQRQKVEGYLAHKWGLVNSLPSKHPYKPSPPIFPPNLFFPTPSMYSALFNTANNPSLTIPANAALTLGTNNHTIEFWLYQTSRGQYDVSFSYGNTSFFATNNYFMSIGTNIGIVIGNGAGNWAINIGGGEARSLNTWHHYAFVRNGTTFTLYINGTSVGSASSSINITAQGDVFRIGNTTTYPINGYMTNFRLVNGTAVYTSNFTPPTTPLTAIPNTQVLIQGLVDRGPNAFTVTNNGGVTLSTSVSPF